MNKCVNVLFIIKRLFLHAVWGNILINCETYVVNINKINLDLK